MPENRSLRPNTIQILRNIQAFRNRLNKNKEYAQSVSNIENVPKQTTEKSIITTQNVYQQRPTMPYNDYGRVYPGHPLFNINGIGPKFKENGGDI